MKARSSNFRQNGREQNSVDLWLKRCQQLSAPPAPISEWNCSKDASLTMERILSRHQIRTENSQVCSICTICTMLCFAQQYAGYWSPQKVSGHGLTPCNSRITQNWQHLGRTQNTVWFSETLFLSLNTRIRSHKKAANKSNKYDSNQIWPRFHKMLDWCGFCFEKG